MSEKKIKKLRKQYQEICNENKNLSHFNKMK